VAVCDRFVSVPIQAAVAALCVLTLIVASYAASDPTPTRLPIPRFVSVKADKVNVHRGPDQKQDVAWVYTRVGWPVEIIAEFENWRRIRDSDGAEGWVYHAMLSGKRTGSVKLKSNTGLAALHAKPDAHSTVTARLQPGVLGTVKRCDYTWCRLVGDGFDGWIAQDELWGVYPDEKID